MIDLYDVPLELQHHGVKGMKWGVRKYKEERSKGVSHLKNRDKQASKKYKAEQASLKQLSKTVSASKKAESRKLDKDFKPSKRNIKKYNKAQQKFNKESAKFDNVESNRINKAKGYNKANYQYYKSVEAAAKLPINIKITPRRSRAKKAIQNFAADAFINTAGAYAGITFSNPRVYSTLSDNSTSYTRKDRFAQAVRSKQISNNK